MDNLPLRVNITDFRDNLAAYLDLAERGKTVVITRHGKPSAELRMVPSAEAIDVEDLAAFRASLGAQSEENVIVKARRGERY